MSVLALTLIPGHGIKFAGDGVVTKAHKAIHGFCSKLTVMSRLDCVLGFTGTALFGFNMHQTIVNAYGRHNSFDDLLRDIASIAEFAHGKTLEADPAYFALSEHNPACCVLIGGYSKEREAFEAYSMTSYAQPWIDGTKPPSVPWRLYQKDIGGWMSWSLPEEVTNEFDVRLDDDVNVFYYPQRCICAARSQSSDFKAVGGFIELVQMFKLNEQIVTFSTIEHRWESDVIGGRVKPEIDAKPAAFYPARPAIVPFHMDWA